MVGLFTPAEMADLRGLAMAAMTETATVKRRVTVSDGGGGQTTSLQTVATGPVLRMPEVAGAGDVALGGQSVQGLRWKLLFAYDFDVRDGDQVTIGTDTFEVVAVASPGTVDAMRLVYALRR